MKKQLTAKKAGLNLTRQTISNLDAAEMCKHLGGLANARNEQLMKRPPLTKRCQGW